VPEGVCSFCGTSYFVTGMALRVPLVAVEVEEPVIEVVRLQRGGIARFFVRWAQGLDFDAVERYFAADLQAVTYSGMSNIQSEAAGYRVATPATEAAES
jgi:hypothetical protein